MQVQTFNGFTVSFTYPAPPHAGNLPSPQIIKRPDISLKRKNNSKINKTKILKKSTIIEANPPKTKKKLSHSAYSTSILNTYMNNCKYKNEYK